MDHSQTQSYRIANTERKQRFDALVGRRAPSDLREELAACRLALETAMNAESPNPQLMANLLTVAGKLAAAHQVIQERSGEMVGRDEAAEFVRRIVAAVSSCLADLPDYTERVDRIVEAIGDIRNPESDYEPEPKLLTVEVTP